MSQRYTIGEFSKLSGLSVKTLRFYHEKDLLVPSDVQASSGYRLYDARLLDRARIIRQLRELDFSLAEITDILSDTSDSSHKGGTDVLVHLENHLKSIQSREQRYREIASSLAMIIRIEREAQVTMETSTFEIEEKLIDPVLIAGVRMQGKYSEMGRGFAKIGRKFGRLIVGKAFSLHYDDEFREDDANFETCMPVREKREAEGISVRELPATRCVTLIHKGAYNQIHRAYARVFDYVKSNGLEVEIPTREVYLKGPGMLFKGNPKKYLTEIQIPVQARA